MANKLFELKLEDSPMPQAMDVYYDEVDALVRSGPSQKIALTNNIVDFPIRSKTRLFNNYVARSFADRSISRGSPIAVGENFLGPANTNDRFSEQYSVLLNRAKIDIELELKQSDLNKIEESQRRVDAFETELNDLIDKVLSDWETHRQAHLQGISEKELALRQVAWLDIHRFRRRVESQTAKIDRELARQEAIIERVGTAEDAQIYRAYTRLRNGRVAFPTGAHLEEELGLDDLKMGNVLVVGTNPSWADIGADITAVADWDNFLTKDGKRGFAISKTSVSQETHEKQWSVTASMRYSWFFSASLNASEHTRTAQSVKDVMSVGMNFKRISEIWIRRGDWYDSSLFNLPRVKKILEKDRKLADNLRYSVASLLIARGFELSLSFEHEDHYQYFRNQQMSGSAKLLNVFPVGSGSVNETWTKTLDNAASKTVSFADDDEVVRIIGFKVDQMHEIGSDDDAMVRGGVFPTSGHVQKMIVDQYRLPADYFATANAIDSE